MARTPRSNDPDPDAPEVADAAEGVVADDVASTTDEQVPAEAPAPAVEPTIDGSAYDAAVASWRRNNPEQAD